MVFAVFLFGVNFGGMGAGPPAPHDLRPWPYPILGRQFEEILYGNSNNASDIIEQSQFSNCTQGCSAVPKWGHARTGVTNDPPK